MHEIILGFCCGLQAFSQYSCNKSCFFPALSLVQFHRGLHMKVEACNLFCQVENSQRFCYELLHFTLSDIKIRTKEVVTILFPLLYFSSNYQHRYDLITIKIYTPNYISKISMWYHLIWNEFSRFFTNSSILKHIFVFSWPLIGWDPTILSKVALFI